MNTILDLIPGVMGLPTINENLSNILKAMAEHPENNLGLGIITNWAKMIGLCIALGVGANECFQMMLGRRALDVMKLLHIVILSMCITFSGSIVSLAKIPGDALEDIAESQVNNINDEVAAKEQEIAMLQETYIAKIRENMNKIEENQRAENAANSSGIVDDILNKIDDWQLQIQNKIKEFAIMAETKICEWISLIIRYLGEILFQVCYYGILISKSIFLHILAAFAPMMFAISLAPHYKSAWSQWLSKFISVSLWGFVTYACLYYVQFIMLYTLECDVASYQEFLGAAAADTDADINVGAIGMQALGSTCMYVVALLIGVRVISFVPEVASWLIPGGVSSSAGSSSSSTGMGAAVTAAGAAGAAAGFVVSGGNPGGATMGKKIGSGSISWTDPKR